MFVFSCCSAATPVTGPRPLAPVTSDVAYSSGVMYLPALTATNTSYLCTVVNQHESKYRAPSLTSTLLHITDSTEHKKTGMTPEKFSLHRQATCQRSIEAPIPRPPVAGNDPPHADTLTAELQLSHIGRECWLHAGRAGERGNESPGASSPFCWRFFRSKGGAFTAERECSVRAHNRPPAHAAHLLLHSLAGPRPSLRGSTRETATESRKGTPGPVPIPPDEPSTIPAKDRQQHIMGRPERRALQRTRAPGECARRPAPLA